MRRHPLDVAAAVWGSLFVLGAAAWLAWDRDWLETSELVWAAPAALITLGVLGVVLSLVPRR